MNIIICGCGDIGNSIVSYLFHEGHQLSVIDTDAETLRKLESEMDLQTVVGVASSPEVLSQAGAADADLIIALTPSDEVNMMICFEAACLFNIPLRIARIRSGFYSNQKYPPFFDDLHVNVVIYPERETAKTILRNIKTPGALEFINMPGDAVFVGAKCMRGCEFLKKTIGSIEKDFEEYTTCIAGIVRSGQSVAIDSKTTLRVGDEVYFVVDNKHCEKILEALGHPINRTDHVVIAGGGRIGYCLAKLMEEEGMADHLSLIEKDEDQAVYLAKSLNQTLVIKGNSMDEDILQEANIDNADAFVSLTGEDEDNILLSLLTKQRGVKRTFALINKQIYDKVLAHLGVDVIINPNTISTSTILQHIRKGQVQSIYSLKQQLGDLMSFEVLETSKIVDYTIGKLRKKKGMRVCGVVRKGHLIKLEDDLKIEVGDSVIILAPSGQFKNVEKLFVAGLFFF
ncbi:MAG: Trk system potassium transporter TrkA [Alphaproteobacteria bacterium]|nr:Trk system potassium transporter TrkA [Alphaproteobacteria bacterium]